MAKETVEALVNGGKASAGPPIGPALGPMGVNIGQVVSEINKKTADFVGMSVPVKIIIDTDTKDFSIKVGTPPASQLIIKEAGIKKGSANPKTQMVADLKMEQIIKVSKMKEDALLGKGPVERVREILGTCQSMGIGVEGKSASETLKDVASGQYDVIIASGKTELSAAELKEQEEEKKRLQEEIALKRDEFLATANEIKGKMGDADRKDIVKAMEEAGLPILIINEVVPEEKTEEGKKE